MTIVKAVQYSTVQGTARYVTEVRRAVAEHYRKGRKSALCRATTRDLIRYARTLTITTVAERSP